MDTPSVQEGVDVDEKSIGSILFKRCKGHIDLTASTGVSNLNLQSQCAGGRFYVPQRRLGSHGAAIQVHLPDAELVQLQV